MNTLVWVLLVIGLPSPIHALNSNHGYTSIRPAAADSSNTAQLYSTQAECNKAAQSYTKPGWATITPQDLVVACIEAYKVR